MKADTIIIDGRSYLWRSILELRRRQLAARKEAAAQQMILFEMHEDHRPALERKAADRYHEPGLFSREDGAET